MEASFNFSGFLRQRRERLRRAAQEAYCKRDSLRGLEALFREYEVSRAFVFGSITRNACRPDSDIDLYVEGVAPEAYWDLLRAVEDHTRERIDLYCDRDDPEFIRKIQERGWLIYEA